MGLTADINKNLGVKDVKRVNYWDTRYYRVLYEYLDGKKRRLKEAHFPSVTEILNAYPHDFLAKWRGDVGNDRADQIIREAWNLGSFIHFGAEVIARGGAVVFNPVDSPLYSDKEVDALKAKYKKQGVAVCRYQKEYVALYRIWQFFQAVKPKHVETEQTVFSITGEYAGTMDLLMWIDEGEYDIAGANPLRLDAGWYVGDYKTGKGVSYTNKMQVGGAYFHAVLEGKPKIAKDMRGALLLHTNNEMVSKGIQGFKAHLVERPECDTLYGHFMKVYEVYKIDKPIPSPKEFSMPSMLVYDTKG